MTERPQDDAQVRAPLLETRLHGFLPFPLLVNAAAVAGLLFAGYALIAVNTGQSFLEADAQGQVAINGGVWAAFVLSLVFAAAVTMPVFAQREWKRALPDLEKTLDAAGIQMARDLAVGPAKAGLSRSLVAFAIGMVAGLLFNYWLWSGLELSPAEFLQSTGLWYLIVQPILFGLGVRAARQLTDDDREIAALVKGHLKVELAGLESLQVYGRLALRSALSWLVMAAIILLFFVYTAPVAVSVGALLLSLAAGSYAFSSTVGPVVKKVGALRDQHLATTREAIEQCGNALVEGKTPEPALSELTAYEAWLEKRPVWPISAPITRRLALYGLIPVLAWFGAAAAELLLGQIAA